MSLQQFWKDFPGLKKVGSYYITAFIGRGSFSWVVQGENYDSCERVAIRVHRNDLVNRLQSFQNFQDHELRTHKAIEDCLASIDADLVKQRRRRSLVRLVELHRPPENGSNGENAGVPAIIQEYVEGRDNHPARSIAELMVKRANKPIHPMLAAIIVRDVAGAAALLHESGFVHGDIHPRNILCSAFVEELFSLDQCEQIARLTLPVNDTACPLKFPWFAKLIDFGLTQDIRNNLPEQVDISILSQAARMELLNSEVGVAEFMAPEEFTAFDLAMLRIQELKGSNNEPAETAISVPTALPTSDVF